MQLVSVRSPNRKNKEAIFFIVNEILVKNIKQHLRGKSFASFVLLKFLNVHPTRLLAHSDLAFYGMGKLFRANEIRPVR